jgi:hypothetical protein
MQCCCAHGVARLAVGLVVPPACLLWYVMLRQFAALQSSLTGPVCGGVACFFACSCGRAAVPARACIAQAGRRLHGGHAQH